MIRYSELNLFAMITTVGLVSILGFLTTLPGQFIIAVPSIGSLGFAIQSNSDTSGYIVCDPNCHILLVIAAVIIAAVIIAAILIAVVMVLKHNHHTGLLSMYPPIHLVSQRLAYP